MAAMTRAVLPVASDPLVTLVVVVHGRYELARATLLALADTMDVEAEIVVVDNASPDRAGERLREELDGPTFLLRDDNLGYGTAANFGAAHGRGAYVGMLNSDLGFEDGWLSSLVGALDADPRAGAAVPMYLSAPGTIDDAGRLVGADGTGYGYGDRFAPNAPEVSFPRYIDYGSAAALLVRRQAFDDVGGFDPIYGLGYFEDADLGFALRGAGWQTVYVPRARVVHRTGGSFSTAMRRAQSERNRPVFAERFAADLRGRPVMRRPPFDPHRDLIARDWLAPDRLLLVDGGGELAEFAAAVQREWPRARVTWVSERAQPTSASTDGGVEWIGAVPRLDRWLESRRFHYSAVITSAGPPELSAWLDHSQPQAARAGPADLGDVTVTMRRLGFGPP